MSAVLRNTWKKKTYKIDRTLRIQKNVFKRGIRNGDQKEYYG